MSIQGQKKKRPLTTVEMRGTKIRHRKQGTIAKISGTYYGGFVVIVTKEKKTLRLPFSNVGQWDVVGRPRRRKK